MTRTLSSTSFKSGGRDGIRTHDLLIANEIINLIRHGVATTYLFEVASKMGDLGDRLFFGEAVQTQEYQERDYDRAYS